MNLFDPLELPVSVAGIADFVSKVGLVTGEPDRARKLEAELLRRIGALETTPGLVGYVELDLGGPVTFGSYSYITDAFRLLGCAQVYEAERTEWLAPDPEVVAERDPDLVVYEPKMFAAFSHDDLERLVRARKWESMKAVRLGNLFITPGPLAFLAHHGPSFITEALPWLERRFVEAGSRIVS